MKGMETKSTEQRRTDDATTTNNRPCVRIEGTTGRYAGVINGLYEATTELSGELPIYVKVDDEDVCLVYLASVQQWQVKLAADKGHDRYYACCGVPVPCSPQDCPVSQWEVVVGDQQIPQPVDTTITLVTHEQVDAYLAEVEREAARVLKGSHNVRIAGATGTAAGVFNGVFKPTEESCSANVSLYIKMVEDDDIMWLEYRARFHQWQVNHEKQESSNRS